MTGPRLRLATAVVRRCAELEREWGLARVLVGPERDDLVRRLRIRPRRIVVQVADEIYAVFSPRGGDVELLDASERP